MAGLASQLEELYRRRYAVFRHAVAGYLGSSEGAHDAVQEGFARALARRETFRGEGSLEAWVYRIVLRTAREQGRRPRDVGLAEELTAPDQPSLAPLLEAVRQLPPRRRLVVFLRFFADLSYAEIAQATGMAEGTVAATLSRARADLAALLSEGVLG
jgi:RNA polymerase sigma-70 factor (ECF subfamily)